MDVLYIKEKDENLTLKQKITFNKIEQNIIDNKEVICIPINDKTRIKKNNRVSKKLNKLLYKKCAKNVVLSNALLKNEIIKNSLYAENINILDGRKLFNLLAKQAVEKVCKLANKQIEEIEISILVNDYDETNMKNIISIAKDVKRLNIVTNHVEKFNNLQDYLYDELGILIKISNNKKKDLLNSKIILNMDFPEEILNKFCLPQKSVIINLSNEINNNDSINNNDDDLSDDYIEPNESPPLTQKEQNDEINNANHTTIMENLLIAESKKMYNNYFNEHITNSVLKTIQLIVHTKIYSLIFIYGSIIQIGGNDTIIYYFY